MLVIVAPGQGAQTPGFLSPWLEIPGLHDRLSAWSDVTGLDLIAYGTRADADEIRDTAVAQPLLVAAGLAVAEVLLTTEGDTPAGPIVPGVLAGHSVGEFTAAAVAGVLTPEQALALVTQRGQAMAKAAGVTETGMTAVLGGDEQEVLAAIERHGLTPANINGAGQIVAAGTTEQLAAFAAEPPARARLRPLSVAGAFHTRHMASAVEHLRAEAAQITPADPRVTLLSNADGESVPSGAGFVERLVDQVARPVRWDLCMATMTDLGVTAMIELLPGGTLTGLAKRAMRGVETVAIKTPDDLAAARALTTKESGL
ncbi:ACP S-malonyltransferase [Sphaerisporangium melleum]|uniref:[acyl-carrier-protein] S-malonyltransferase n=1 Tax=Sphaerisporangium melleum TaxID=321316 RepID=A0A917VII1_9ACTN|nr:ACP S-malonyltransferase [Sphaerisporangium melleum]GGK82483.1 ACP S-malonyltransferase [Sphaerisporangium melleum]GII71331.1 ACP S-malonyltransferase [Sphaerisporangium melleum]